MTDTGGALRDGVEAGIQAANQQFSRASEQVIDSTRNAGQEFGRQLQGFANDPAEQLRSTTGSVRRRNRTSHWIRRQPDAAGDQSVRGFELSAVGRRGTTAVAARWIAIGRTNHGGTRYRSRCGAEYAAGAHPNWLDKHRCECRLAAPAHSAIGHAASQ